MDFKLTQTIFLCLLIDRVEVNNVGGASVYGADAVAGVVNYVLKDDFEGFKFQHDYNNIS